MSVCISGNRRWSELAAPATAHESRSPKSTPYAVIGCIGTGRPTESTRAEDHLRLSPRVRADLPRTSRTGPREPDAPPAIARDQTHRHPAAAQKARSAVLDRVGEDVAALAGGARARPTRHRGPMASLGGSAAGGHGTRGSVQAVRLRMPPFARWCARWPMPI